MAGRLSAIEQAVRDDITANLRSYSRIHVAPDIPEKVLAGARGSYLSDRDDEQIVLIADETFFGSAGDGFTLTTRRVYWRNNASEQGSMAYADIPGQVEFQDGFFMPQVVLGTSGKGPLTQWIPIDARPAIAACIERARQRYANAAGVSEATAADQPFFLDSADPANTQEQKTTTTSDDGRTTETVTTRRYTSPGGSGQQSHRVTETRTTRTTQGTGPFPEPVDPFGQDGFPGGSFSDLFDDTLERMRQTQEQMFSGQPQVPEVPEWMNPPMPLEQTQPAEPIFEDPSGPVRVDVSPRQDQSGNKQSGSGQSRSTQSSSTQSGTVDLNSAGTDQLLVLPGLTLELAERLVRERQERGGFRSMDEIRILLGLQPHVMQRLQQQVTLRPYRGKASPPGRRGARIVDF